MVIRNDLVAFVFLTILTLTASCYAHLGEEHPPGEHQYFADIPATEIPFDVDQLENTTGSWWTDAHSFPGDADRMMLSSRFQSLHVVTDGGQNLFLTTGENYAWEFEGMSAFEFHPEFNIPESPGFGKFYTITTEAEAAQSPDYSRAEGNVLDNVIREWTVDDPSSNVFSGASREIMRFRESSKFHNVNDLEFDDEGMLFIALGEDTGGSPAQNLESVYGKILRIDPLGTNGINGQFGIPADNPFVHDPEAAHEVYAYGLRNPWRITFDSETQQLWAFDVGHRSIEEVNQIVPGGNYGWPIKEGTFLAGNEVVPDPPDPSSGLTTAEELGLIDPVFEYDHTQGSTVIGGIVYRGEEFPWLQGKVIFADLGYSSAVSGIVPRLFYGDPGTGEMFQLLDHDAFDRIWGTCGAGAPCSIYSINKDPDGEIMILGKSVLRLTSLPADFTNDGQLDVLDLELLTAEVASGSGNLQFDVDQDGDVDDGDRVFWIKVRKHSFMGDSNLDGVFDSSDVVQVFAAGEYEDGIPRNSGWADGDWDGDGDFTSTDIVVAFQDGGYEQGPREPVAVVPEPGTAGLLAIGLVAIAWVARRL